MSLTTVPPRLLARLRTSRIGLRVLAFNLLVLVLPVAGILYLDTYESQLLEAQERGMVEQGRVLAAALGGGPLTAQTAAATIGRLGVETDSRYRVFGSNGELLADSRRILLTPTDRPATYQASSRRDAFLYKVGAWLVRVRDRGVRLASRLQRQPDDSPAEESAIPSELVAALQGRYGAAARPTAGQRSMTLHSALPIQAGEQVVGAVVVSQSTYRVLQALYGLRLQIFRVVVGSAILAALLSVLMSATIVRPLVRLKGAAMSLTERRTPLSGTFAVVNRADEIGDLAKSLELLWPVVLAFEASDFIGSPRFDLESDFIESLDDGEAAGGELGLDGEGDCAKAAVANTPLSAVVTNNFFNIVEPPCRL
jgi:two-component system sensor histidine kinase ChvG